MRTFVTGASGFLGRRVVHRLLEDGHRVRVLVRRPEAYRAPDGAAVTVGSLDSLPEWKEQLTGQDVVIHAAGIIETWAPWQDFDRAIVSATRRLLAAAAAAGVRRFVYLSSESVLQAGRPLVDIDESAPLPRRPSSSYGLAKALAETAVRGRTSAIETVVLRPTFIWGEGSAQLADLVRRAQAGTLPLFDHGRALFEHVHVDNAAAAVCAAVTRGEKGAVYFVTNDEAMPVADFLRGVLTACDAPMPRVSVPSALLFPVASGCEGLWRGLPLPDRPPVTRFELEFLALPRRYRITAARTDLGYQPQATYAAGVASLRAGTPTPA